MLAESPGCPASAQVGRSRRTELQLFPLHKKVAKHREKQTTKSSMAKYVASLFQRLDVNELTEVYLHKLPAVLVPCRVRAP